MYCKKCKYTSFDHVTACPKCGTDWEEARKSLYLNWINANGYQWLAARSEGRAPTATATPAMSRMAPPVAPSIVNTDELFLDAPDDSTDKLLDLSQTPRSAKTAEPTPEIDLSLFPELDFSAPQAKTAGPAPSAPQTTSSQKEDDDLFLDSAADDAVELDFSASFEEPAPKPSKAKREDLFIPELEEMLAPLTEEIKPAPAPGKSGQFSGAGDIVLDFGTTAKSSPGSASRKDTDDLFLDLDATKP